MLQPQNLIRLCLDLNIWCASLLSDRKGKQNSSSQSLVTIIRQGYCEIGLVQLIISWGMINRLRSVLEEQLSIPTPLVDSYLSAIINYTQLESIYASPQLTLGGTGVVAIRDEEDAHVLETALAGKTNVLVTVNFKDFISNDTRIIQPARHLIYTAPNDTFHIVHPDLMMEWLRQDNIPDLDYFK
jgi:predicted nucleic acid-binding protein